MLFPSVLNSFFLFNSCKRLCSIQLRGEGFTIQDNLTALKQTQQELIRQLGNPFQLDLKQIYLKVQEINQILVQHRQIRYHCKQCNRSHTPKSKIYPDHALYAEFSINFPPISMEPYLSMRKTSIVGIYYAQSGTYLLSLPLDVSFTLVAEPDNAFDNHAVAVYHQDRKLGYIPRAENTLFFNALQNHWHVQCTLESYCPSHIHRGYTNFQPQRAKILVTLCDLTKLEMLLKGLIELNAIGHPDVLKTLKDLGPLALKTLESWDQQGSDWDLKQLLSGLYAEYKVSIANSNELFIML